MSRQILTKIPSCFFTAEAIDSLKRGSPLPKPKMHHIASIPQLPGSFVTFCRIERANKKCWTSLAWAWLRHTTSQRTPLHTLPGQTSYRETNILKNHEKSKCVTWCIFCATLWEYSKQTSYRGLLLRNICPWLYIVVNMQEVERSSTEFRDIEFEPMLIYL